MNKIFTGKLWKLMKICAAQGMIAVFLCGVSIAHDNYAQLLDKKVTVTVDNASFEKTLNEIAVIAGIRFAYSLDQLKVEETITLHAEQRALREVLSELLQPHHITYKVHERDAMISLRKERVKKDESQSPVPDTPDETRPSFPYQVTGRVTDVDDQPVAGVNIVVKGTTRGTSTDSEGRYAIDADENDVLVFSFIGYKTVEMNVSAITVLDVVMESDVETLKTVEINAGYWKVNEREQTGNISRVTAEEIQRQPVSNPLQAMIGRMPGVYINQQNGLPGGGIDVQIRGRNSIRSDGNNPLYIVDGVPFTSTTLASSSIASPFLNGTSPLNSINPNDIESIEVLKDADATAIYGSRGANGVILITTKKGQAGKTKLDVNFYRGAGKVTRRMELLSSQQYMEMRREAFSNDNVTNIPAFNYDMTGAWDTTRYTNWQNELIGGTAYSTNIQASISGGDISTQFLIGGGYYKETTVYSGTLGYQKASVHFNLSHASQNKKFKATLTGNFVSDKNELPSTDLTGLSISLAPVAPSLYDENGKLNWQNSTWTNPLSFLNQKYQNVTDNLIANSNFSYEVLKGLQVKTRLGYTSTTLNEISTRPLSSYDPAWVSFYTGAATFGSNNIKTWIVEPQADYVKIIGESKLTALIGTTFQQTLQEGETISASGFTNDALIENIRAAPTVSVLATNYTQYRYNAQFGRINYNLKDRYIINVTARRDGSSRFGPGRQFATFGGIGAAWIFSNEGFIQNDLLFLSFGKIRASYGTTGSDQIPDYGYLDTYTAATYPYQGLGLLPTRLVNPDYRWETNKKIEAAVELGVLQDRIFLALSYYRNRSSNQLVGYSLPFTTGQSTIQYNLPAVVQNTGVELALNTTNVKINDFRWTTAINFTMPRNKLVEYPNIEGSPYVNSYMVGEPLSIQKRYHSTKVDAQTGLYTFEDIDGNGSGTNFPADLQALKKIGQDFFGGIQNTIRYKGIQLDIFFQFVKQTGNNYLLGFSNAPGTRFNQPVVVMSRWRTSGDISNIQMFTQTAGSLAGSAYNNYRSSDATIEDASFIRLKNISVSYELSNRLIQKIHLQNFRILFQGQNLLTITNYVGFDPENQNTSVLPPMRMMSAGIQFSL